MQRESLRWALALSYQYFEIKLEEYAIPRNLKVVPTTVKKAFARY